MANTVHVVHWREIRAHIEGELAAVASRLEGTDDRDQMLRLQGEARGLRKLLVLPDTLSFLKEE
jgi:hypothetical protein